MVKYLKRTVLLLSLSYICITGIVIAFPEYYMDQSFSIFKYGKELIEHNAFGVNTIIIGDSRAQAGFVPDSLTKTTINGALLGSSPIEGYFQLEKLMKQGASIDTLIVSYGALHLMSSEYYFINSLRYSYLNINDVNTIHNTFNYKNDAFWEIHPSELSYFEQYTSRIKAYLILLKCPLYFQESITSSKFRRNKPNRSFYSDLVKNKGYYLYGKDAFSNALNEETKEEDFIVNSTISTALKELFKLAQANNIHVVYVNMPYNKASYNQLSTAFINNYKNYMNSLKQEFPEVEFKSELFLLSNGYFGDASHLNRKGAIKMTQFLNTVL
ncbi:hypothetical protein [Winogradskyella arenosi]|uniref:DUF1574 domain-containing protein n=1 Tax=Winogradskyella arenosi TaxID=533325 RepID=A0A368ZE90_9FLAO|nr:hypothetical protein [Winogradskyella arenosi]RCW90254.1 hypothetical protein DFQ08_105143 [Winogradskyella arenosi]